MPYRSRIRLSMLFLAAFVLAGCASADPPVRILFVGNSYTYYNNMPAIAEALYEASGAGTMETAMLVQAGQRLSDAAGPRLPELLRMMMGGRWDYVVLQGQSTLGGAYRDGRPVIGDASVFRESAKTLDREIQKAGGRTVLLMTWANAAAPDQQHAITAVYESIGAEIGASVVPAGRAWSVVLRQHPGIPLHQNDGSHPNENGSYLTACTLLSTLFELDLSDAPNRVSVPDVLSPGRRGTQVVEIDPEVARILRQAAAGNARGDE